jgi:hypothetical protein
MQVSYLSVTGRVSRSIILDGPVNVGVVRLADEIGDGGSEEGLNNAVRTALEMELSLLCVQYKVLSDENKTKVRFWASRLAEVDSKMHFVRGQGILQAETLSDLFTQRYLASLTDSLGCVHLVSAPIVSPKDNPWFSLYLETYGIWWNDRQSKADDPLAVLNTDWRLNKRAA